eukprot:1145176-Pelagomonas_calceolata.AAC.5
MREHGSDYRKRQEQGKHKPPYGNAKAIPVHTQLTFTVPSAAPVASSPTSPSLRAHSSCMLPFSGSHTSEVRIAEERPLSSSKGEAGSVGGSSGMPAPPAPRLLLLPPAVVALDSGGHGIKVGCECGTVSGAPAAAAAAAVDPECPPPPWMPL